MVKYKQEVIMDQDKLKEFFDACDDFINCKFLVAEYKLQRMLQVLSQNEEICSLIGECLEQFNRDREFAKAFIQDGQGEDVLHYVNKVWLPYANRTLKQIAA